MENNLNKNTQKIILKLQQDEVNDNILYGKMAAREKNKENKALLEKIASDEKRHAEVWKTHTKKDLKPKRFFIFIINLISILMGYTFTIKRMEKGEKEAIKNYTKLREEIPEVSKIIEDEERHEEELINMLDEERLHYVGAMVLGLNDALVELTGTIAGLTFALMNTRLVALSGIITGASATLSMAASNYLAERADDNPKALKSSVYTGIAYLLTVILMVLPYLLFPNDMYVWAFIVMIAIVLLIIIGFNYYIAVAKSQSFGKRFKEMALISLSVTIIAYIIGLVAKQLLGIDV